jgi:hypothetical protein
VAAWLEADHIPWRPALTARIGTRWAIRADPRAQPDRLEISLEEQ